MKISFWGVNGSIATPLDSNNIQQRIFESIKLAKDKSFDSDEDINNFIKTLPEHLKYTYHGNTSCISILPEEEGNDIFVFDAGTGLRNLGNAIMTQKNKYTINLFLSHCHWDHIQGFPFFVPAYIPGTKINIYGAHENLKGVFNLQQNSVNFPVPLSVMSKDITFNQLEPEESWDINGVKISVSEQEHPGKSYAYKLTYKDKTVVYATDSEYKNLIKDGLDKYIDFFNGTDILIFDAQYTFIEAYRKYDWGHSSVSIGVELAAKAGVKKMFLFHHEPNYDDEKINKILQNGIKYKNIFMKHNNVKTDLYIELAYDGLEITL